MIFHGDIQSKCPKCDLFEIFSCQLYTRTENLQIEKTQVVIFVLDLIPRSRIVLTKISIPQKSYRFPAHLSFPRILA
mgnify:CR=1 FL=1